MPASVAFAPASVWNPPIARQRRFTILSDRAHHQDDGQNRQH